MEQTLGRLAAGDDLSMDDTSRAIEAIMLGLCTDAEIALFLTGLRLKGETVAEIAGAAAALRRHMTPIRTARTGVIDTCGTGGDGSKTFNISTAAALVAAAAGVTVAKHGNRRVTSTSGSADVLVALGVNIEADVLLVETCLEELGICFCFAPLLHGAMKHVAAVRQQLAMPTIFNLLGPLSNPAGASFQLLGVGREELRPTMAEALALLGTERAIVVCGEDGLDEVTLSGPTNVSETHGGRTREFVWHPYDFGLESASLDSMKVTSADESAAVIREVLAGERGPRRDIVVANAAAALWTAGKTATPQAAARLAAEAIDSRAARELLAALVRKTNATSA
ncbi:MAG: anthranilate phosphoribosyltransferase [Planctomycetia bacterium]|nr:anthranilate phosphoribosyltransferase [Planctomycetia bacterium]